MEPVYVWFIEEPDGTSGVRDIDKSQLLFGASLIPVGGTDLEYLRRYLDDVA